MSNNKTNVRIEGTKMESGNNIGSINTGKISYENSFNYSDNANPELKSKMSELNDLVNKLNNKVEPQVGEQAVEDFKNLEKEITTEKPRKALFEAYTGEIIKAASYCSTLVEPITKVINEIKSFINF